MKIQTTTERIMRSGHTQHDPFTVSLLPTIASAEKATQIAGILCQMQTEQPLCDTQESMRLVAHDPCSRDRLLHQLDDLLARHHSGATIVIGDEFVEPTDVGYKPSRLVDQVRAIFLQPSHVEAGDQCGLIALAPGAPMRTRDVDSCIDANRLARESLDRAIQRTANGLWLKSRHARSSLVEGGERNRGAIEVRIVGFKQQLLECLQLRHRVYGWMGYLDDELSQTDSKLEIDPFDKVSLHFAAVDPRSDAVVGTLRLVTSVPPMIRHTAIGDPRRLMEAQKRWCKSIAQDAADTVIRQRLQSNLRLPLPILQNSNFGEYWPEFLHANRSNKGGEISRVVVSPRYRGLGLSTLLMRAAIAVACELKKTYLLLECIPCHAGMYSRLGFELLKGHHCRTQGLDQVAVGMRLDLNDSPYNKPARLAALDVATMHAAHRPRRGDATAGCQSFCLCDLRPCWQDGRYALRGQEICPLTHLLAKSKD